MQSVTYGVVSLMTAETAVSLASLKHTCQAVEASSVSHTSTQVTILCSLAVKTNAITTYSLPSRMFEQCGMTLLWVAMQQMQLASNVYCVDPALTNLLPSQQLWILASA